jgi:hypothetical protein
MNMIFFMRSTFLILLTCLIYPTLQADSGQNIIDDEGNVAILSNASTAQDQSPSFTPGLSFGVFTFSNDTDTMQILNKYYAHGNRTDYVIETLRSLSHSSWLFDAFPDEIKTIIAPSLNGLRDATTLGSLYNVNLILYDIEHWNLTPNYEKRDPIQSITKGSDIVHSGGFQYGIAPDADYLLNYYKEIDWRKIDFLTMQLQKFSQNITQYSSFAKDISGFVKAVNPNIKVFAQVSFRYTDGDETIKAVKAVRGYIDGVNIIYLPGTERNLCFPNCTPENLNKTLSEITKTANCLHQ